MERQLRIFFKFLEQDKKLSSNTLQSYRRDLKQFKEYLEENEIHYNRVHEEDIKNYIKHLQELGKKPSTISRSIASIRSFYQHVVKRGKLKEDPTGKIQSPKIEKREIEFLSIEEIERLLSLPDDTHKGIRDRAILELLYATGIRATELIQMKTADVNLRMGFVKCDGSHSKARIIPMGRLCRKAMEDYMLDVRDKMLRGKESEVLFVNYMGESLTRQGLWKVMKEYGEAAGLNISLTPQIIRNSFAVHMLQNGADVKSLQELMGHEDIAATQAYLAVTKNRIKDVYDKAHPRA